MRRFKPLKLTKKHTKYWIIYHKDGGLQSESLPYAKMSKYTGWSTVTSTQLSPVAISAILSPAAR